jgi:hypothetical protein
VESARAAVAAPAEEDPVTPDTMPSAVPSQAPSVVPSQAPSTASPTRPGDTLAPSQAPSVSPSLAPGAEGTDAPKRRAGSDSTTFMQITTGVCRVLESQLDQLEGVWADAVGRGATYLVDQYNFTEDPLDTGK